MNKPDNPQTNSNVENKDDDYSLLNLKRLTSGEKKYNINNRMGLLRKAKDIHIPLYGSVSITLMAKCFIDNKFFQRLYDLKQLGVCDYVYPGAKHTRGEHSIGTYYLTEKILTRIKSSTDDCKLLEWLLTIPELKTHFSNKDNQPGLNNWIIELIKIGALCHDVGHGPYSHLFDDHFIANSEYKSHEYATHEARSCAIVKMIVDESPTLSKFMTSDDIKFIQSIIDPSKDRIGFVYQIVSNNLNGLDVDKYDYICRDSLHTGIKNGFDYSRLIDSVIVIDDKIVYPEQSEHDIYSLFSTRHAMHRKVYGHKAVISAQYMILELLSIVDKVDQLSKSITSFDKFVKMTDSYVFQKANFILEMKDCDTNPFGKLLTTKDYNTLSDVLTRLQSHNLYVNIGTIISKTPINLDNDFKDDIYRIYKSKVGFVSGNKENPLDKIYVYKTKDLFLNGISVKARKINKNEISYIIPEIYQEHITNIYRTDRDDVGIRSDKERIQKIKNYINATS